MKIDLTCPVELWQVSKPTAEAPECTVVLNNLSEKIVISVQVTMICYDQAEEMLFRQIERIQGLNAGAGERFSVVILPTQWENVAGVELVVEKVWFGDAMIWRRGNAALTEYESNALPSGRKLDQLRFVAGQDAVGYPSLQEHVWVCVCGRANAKAAEFCCRCGRRAETIFASFAPQNVDQLIAVHEQKLRDIAKKAREDAAKLTEEREAEERKKRSKAKSALTLTVAGICLAAIGVVAVFWGIPTYRYQQADKLLQNGQFTEARVAFSAMGDYGDAKDRLLRCDYLEAQTWLGTKNDGSLQKAAEVFQGLGDYEESAVLAQQAAYERGLLALEAKDYPLATEHFQAAGNYQKSPEMRKEAVYLQGKKLFVDGDFMAAEAVFISLEGYKDSQESIVECRYAVARAAEEAGDYQKAIDLYTAIGTYEDVPQRLQSVCYLLAEQRMAQNDLEAAGQWYLQAGDHLDARLKANDCLYQLAQQSFASQDYPKAKELFEKIIPYLDSESRSWDCVYQQAVQAETAANYAVAVELFESIPQHRDAKDKAQECRYLLATESIAKGNLAEAEALLSSLEGFRDGAKLLKQTRYQLAEKAAGEGNYAKAVELFEALGNYLGSAQRLKDCRYQMAKNALIDKQYEVAIEGFTQLGNYEDAQQYLATATYEYAMSRQAAGDTEKALSLLGTVNGDEEARQQMLALTLAEAKRKKDAGDLAGANAMLLPLQEEPEAKELYLSWQYEEAMEKKNAGLYSEAGKLFLALGAYQDAAAQGAECYEKYYGVVAGPAREASGRKDYRTVIETLDGFPMAELPREYRDLLELYQQACYLYAEQLFNDGKPYEALPYYQRIVDYRDVGGKLERRCYLLLGKWKSVTGEVCEFRADGTCALQGENLTFNVDNYSLFTAKAGEKLTLTHKLTNVTQTSLTLRDTRNGQNVVYKYERTEGVELAPATFAPLSTPAPTPNLLDEMLVQEDDDDASPHS